MIQEQLTDAPTRSSVWRIVVYVLVGRIVVAATRRFPYPFLPDIADRLNVPLGDVQRVMGVQATTGFLSPLSGPVAERYGRKRVMLMALALMATAALLSAVSSTFLVFAVGMLLLGVGKPIFDPAMYAYVSDRVPFYQRGRALGIIEVSYSLSLLFSAGIVLLAFGLDGLRLLFILLALSLSAVMLVLWRILPNDTPDPESAHSSITPNQIWRVLKPHPRAWWALAYGVLISIPHEMIFATYAAWLETKFGFSIEALGAITIMIFCAELVGELFVASASDRIGLSRTCLAASLLGALGLGALPFLPIGLGGGLVLLFGIFIALEVAIVAAFPLFSEIIPSARSIMMASSVASMSLGHALGGFLVSGAYVVGGFELVGILSMVIGLGACFTVWKFR